MSGERAARAPAETHDLASLARAFVDAVAQEFEERGGAYAAFESGGIVVIIGRQRKAEALRELVRVHWGGRVQRGKQGGDLRARSALPAPSRLRGKEHE